MATERRHFSRDFKLMALARMEAAGNVDALAKELGIRREMLYVWRRKYQAGGAEALHSAGRPRPWVPPPEALDAAAHIAALERKLGEQSLEIDFLEGALRRIEASSRPIERPGATASSPRSKR